MREWYCIRIAMYWKPGLSNWTDKPGFYFLVKSKVGPFFKARIALKKRWNASIGYSEIRAFV